MNHKTTFQHLIVHYLITRCLSLILSAVLDPSLHAESSRLLWITSPISIGRKKQSGRLANLNLDMDFELIQLCNAPTETVYLLANDCIGIFPRVVLAE